MRDDVTEVAPGRCRKNSGRSYEDFVIGHINEHRPGRTITDADNMWFTLLTMMLADQGATVIKVEPPGVRWAIPSGHCRAAG